MEFELCKFFHTTPKGLGKLRDDNPAGFAFIERTMIHRWNREADERKKAESRAKMRRGTGRR